MQRRRADLVLVRVRDGVPVMRVESEGETFEFAFRTAAAIGTMFEGLGRSFGELILGSPLRTFDPRQDVVRIEAVVVRPEAPGDRATSD